MAARRTRMRRWRHVTPARSNCAAPTGLLRSPFPRSLPASTASRPIARPPSRSRPPRARWLRLPPSAGSSSAAFRMTAPACTPRRWPGSAALVPIEPAAKLLGTSFRGGGMYSRHGLRSLVAGALLIAVAPSARAEGTFDIPAGARFNPQKLERVGDFLRDQVAQGKIPGAILMIEQHGKPVYHEFFGVQDVASRQPMTDQTIFRLFSMTKAITSVAAMMLVDEGKLVLDDPIAK